ncbi:MAG: DNA-binding protein [Alphaproteobacteria bacterium]|nr:DNA-binding protein [Alphaproteobacteria bacterium]
MPSATSHHEVVRLEPGDDPRGRLEALQRERGWQAASVVSAVGSLTVAAIRYADREETTLLRGPLEVTSLSGTLGPDGPHLHLSVADGRGRTRGGHLSAGSAVYTTLELVVLVLDDVTFHREPDPVTTWRELVPRRSRTPGGRDTTVPLEPQEQP